MAGAQQREFWLMTLLETDYGALGTSQVGWGCWDARGGALHLAGHHFKAGEKGAGGGVEVGHPGRWEGSWRVAVLGVREEKISELSGWPGESLVCRGGREA